MFLFFVIEINSLPLKVLDEIDSKSFINCSTFNSDEDKFSLHTINILNYCLNIPILLFNVLI